jgi:hypothetical protein
MCMTSRSPHASYFALVRPGIEIIIFTWSALKHHSIYSSLMPERKPRLRSNHTCQNVVAQSYHSYRRPKKKEGEKSLIFPAWTAFPRESLSYQRNGHVLRIPGRHIHDIDPDKPRGLVGCRQRLPRKIAVQRRQEPHADTDSLQYASFSLRRGGFLIKHENHLQRAPVAQPFFFSIAFWSLPFLFYSSLPQFKLHAPIPILKFSGIGRELGANPLHPSIREDKPIWRSR